VVSLALRAAKQFKLKLVFVEAGEKHVRDALVALHFQNDVCHRDGKIPFSLQRDTPEAEAFLAASREALRSARARNWSVAHVHIGFAEDYSDLPRNGKLFNKVLEFGAVKRGSWGAAPFAGFEPEANEIVVSRNCNSGFRRTNLEDELRRRGIDRLNVMGMATQFSVEHTVRDASDLGFFVRILADCCRSADMEAHRASLRTLAMLAEIVTSGEVFADDAA
jgi:nicotinamidase-related amidase